MFKFVLTSKTVSIVASVASSTAVLFAHGPFLDDQRKMNQLYNKHEEVPLSSKHQELAQEVLRDLKVKDPSCYSFFYCFGQNTRNAGWPPLGKAIIGIPFNFSYDSIINIEPLSIQMPGRRLLDWTSEDGEAFIKSLVLSRDAQKFALAREIFYNQNPRVPLHAFLMGTFFALQYAFSSVVKSKLAWEKLSRFSRACVHSLSAFIAVAAVLSVKDAANIYWERKADIKAGQLSPSYYRGGLEFYGKMKDRHVALHNLKFDHIYTSNGNLKTFIRMPLLPVSAHLDTLREIAAPHLIEEE